MIFLCSSEVNSVSKPAGHSNANVVVVMETEMKNKKKYLMLLRNAF